MRGNSARPVRRGADGKGPWKRNLAGGLPYYNGTHSLTQVAEALSAQLGERVTLQTVVQGLQAHAQIGTRFASSALSMAETTLEAAEIAGTTAAEQAAANAARQGLAQAAAEAEAQAARLAARRAVLNQTVKRVATRGALTVAGEVVASLAGWIALIVMVAAAAAAVSFISGRLGARSADKPIQPGPRMSQPGLPVPRPNSEPSSPVSQPGAVTTAPAYEVWERKGPFYASGDTEGRMPPRLTVSEESLEYPAEIEGQMRKNTLMWTAPPETLHPGDEVMLTMTATSDERGASVGGWWNSNCQSDGKGDNGAGSLKTWRYTGDPHAGTFTFKFTPGANPYIRVSAGHDPAPDTWVLVTWKYERKAP